MNLLNDRIYIGAKFGDPTSITVYQSCGKLLNADIEKYGIENFKKIVLLENIPTANNELDITEKLGVTTFNSHVSNGGYNMTINGGNCRSQSSESKLKLSKATKITSKGERNGMFGKKHTDDSKLKMSISQKETAKTNYINIAKGQCENIRIFENQKGEQFTVYNVSHFCSINNLSRTLFNVLPIGKIQITDITDRSTKGLNTIGWEFNTLYGLISPDLDNYSWSECSIFNLSPRTLRNNKDNGKITINMLPPKVQIQINSVGWKIIK
jgi:hypothetical protein